MVALTETAKLHRAVKEGDWEEASRLVAQGVSAAPKTQRYAAQYRDQPWVDLLSELASPVAGGAKKEEWLYGDILRGDRKAAEALIAGGVVPDELMLMTAVRYLDASWVKLLAEAMAAAEVELPPYQLYCAIIDRHDDKGFALLEAGAVPDDETVSRAIMAGMDSGWIKMLLDARAAAGHAPTPNMLELAIGSCSSSAVFVANDLIERGVVPADRTFVYAVKHRDRWAGKLLDAMLAAGCAPTPDMRDAAVKYGREALVQKLEEAMNDDKKTASEAYNDAAAKKDAPKLVQGTAFRPTPRLVRSASLKAGL